MNELTKREKIALEFAKAVGGNLQLIALLPDVEHISVLEISTDRYFRAINMLTDEFLKRCADNLSKKPEWSNE